MSKPRSSKENQQEDPAGFDSQFLLHELVFCMVGLMTCASSSVFEKPPRFPPVFSEKKDGNKVHGQYPPANIYRYGSAQTLGRGCSSRTLCEVFSFVISETAYPRVSSITCCGMYGTKTTSYRDLLACGNRLQSRQPKASFSSA